jgi:hypothetical protein
MPYIDFTHLKTLTPQAFKLYACFLDMAENKNTTTLTLPLSDLGGSSGLQAYCPYPALRHGKDGQLRRAIAELITRGLIHKKGQRGRKPNTYTLLNPPDPHTQNQTLLNGEYHATITLPLYAIVSIFIPVHLSKNKTRLTVKDINRT